MCPAVDGAQHLLLPPPLPLQSYQESFLPPDFLPTQILGWMRAGNRGYPGDIRPGGQRARQHRQSSPPGTEYIMRIINLLSIS